MSNEMIVLSYFLGAMFASVIWYVFTYIFIREIEAKYGIKILEPKKEVVVNGYEV